VRAFRHGPAQSRVPRLVVALMHRLEPVPLTQAVAILTERPHPQQSQVRRAARLYDFFWQRGCSSRARPGSC